MSMFKSFLSNNVKGIKASEKKLGLFEYFRNLSTPIGFVFLREAHSSVDVEKNGTTIKDNCLLFFHTVRQILVNYP